MSLKYLAALTAFLFLLTACSETSQPAEQHNAGSADDAVQALDMAEALNMAEALDMAEAPADPGEAYLFINARKSGVKVLESGLQFEILKQGEGRSPGLTSNVVTHYTGKFIDGKVFDSSVERGTPAEFPVNRVIAGWTEALQMMKEGDSWRLVIPSHLAYGERGAGATIPPNSVLVFEVELIEVKD